LLGIRPHDLTQDNNGQHQHERHYLDAVVGHNFSVSSGQTGIPCIPAHPVSSRQRITVFIVARSTTV